MRTIIRLDCPHCSNALIQGVDVPEALLAGGNLPPAKAYAAIVGPYLEQMYENFVQHTAEHQEVPA